MTESLDRKCSHHLFFAFGLSDTRCKTPLAVEGRMILTRGPKIRDRLVLHACPYRKGSYLFRPKRYFANAQPWREKKRARQTKPQDHDQPLISEKKTHTHTYTRRKRKEAGLGWTDGWIDRWVGGRAVSVHVCFVRSVCVYRLSHMIHTKALGM